MNGIMNEISTVARKLLNSKILSNLYEISLYSDIVQVLQKTSFLSIRPWLPILLAHDKEIKVTI